MYRYTKKMKHRNKNFKSFVSNHQSCKCFDNCQCRLFSKRYMKRWNRQILKLFM